ncbi:MAG: FlgD immunoglobulin-like domain containing protein [Bacteroidota bacterium]
MKKNLFIQRLVCRNFSEVGSAGRSFNVVGQLILLLILISTIETTAQSPSWIWAKSAGGTDDDRSLGSSTDAGGNVFVTGYFRGPSITFGSTTLTNAGGTDIFVVKYSPSGNVLWATSAGGSTDDVGYGISTDAGGNVVVTGLFASPSITFGNTTLTLAGNYDIFVVKYSPSGNVLWATSAGGTYNDVGYGISTDTAGNVFVTGNFSSPSITFGSTTLTNAGSYKIFVAKYDASGNAVWATSAGGTGWDYGNGISTDADGNVLVTGSFKSPSITFGSTTLTNTGGGYDDFFVVKYDTAGNVVWAESAGGTGIELGTGVSTDAGGNVVVTGYFYSPSIIFGSSTLTNAGGSDIFVVKYSPSGNVVWAVRAGGTDYDAAKSIATDAVGDVFVSGEFSSSITFDSTTLTNAGFYEIFAVKYDISGNVVWATNAVGTSSSDGTGISTDASGNVLITGIFYNSSITFGGTTLTNAGNFDMFVAKLDNITGLEENIKNDEVSIFPNPCSTGTTISFSLSLPIAIGTEKISIKIFDITGRLVETIADGEMQEGVHQLEWNTKDEKGNLVNAGIYFLKLETINYSETKKLSVVR